MASWGYNATKVSEPSHSIRYYQLGASVDAAKQQFGDEATAAVVQAMPEDVQKTISDISTAMSWIPVENLITWTFGVWEGPAERSRDTMVEYTRRQVDLGFGRVRRALLTMVSPKMLLNRAPELWDRDNRGGRVTVEVDDKQAVWTLSDHPYCETPHARASMAEVLIYCIEMTRAKNVSGTHGLYLGSLRVTLRWQ